MVRSTPVPSARAGLALLFAVLVLGADGPAAWLSLQSGSVASPPDRTRALTREEQEQFLLRATVVRTRSSNKGVTGTLRATLDDGTMTHDASIQVIDKYHDVFQSKQLREIGFRDTWRYNVAAYQLSLLLGIDMVPVTVQRRYAGQDAAFTWWIDDVLMDEGERLKANARAPASSPWNHQLWTLRIFDQLIENTDRNLGNMLIDRSWKVWMIDHTRAFRRQPRLRNAKNLERCDRRLLEALKALDAETLERKVGRWLRRDERDPILARRDLIVAFFEASPQRVYEPPDPEPTSGAAQIDGVASSTLLPAGSRK